MRIFLHLSYKGTQYRGWQRQASSLPETIQQIVEEALISILKYNCYVSGCGRTDAGVHASTFYFSLDLKSDLDFDLVERLNRVLPNDIKVVKLYDVNQNQNTRFDAVERIYNYYFHTTQNPFDIETSTFIDYEVDISQMLLGINSIAKIEDFRFLCKQPDKHRTTTCKINHIRLYTNENKTHYRVEISADRFLRGMIRIIMSRLLAIGKGMVTFDEFNLWVIGKVDINSKPAYPQGLFLTDVRYSFLDTEEEMLKNMPHQLNWIPLN